MVYYISQSVTMKTPENCPILKRLQDGKAPVEKDCKKGLSGNSMKF